MQQKATEDIILCSPQLAIGFAKKGGAMVRLQHRESSVNPINFSYAESPDIGDQYTGHFICTPRWGDTSAGEKASGLKKHGDCCQLDWHITASSAFHLQMEAESRMEQCVVKREVWLQETSPVFHVREIIKNNSAAYRACNIVQHPTVAAPFLHQYTRVDCNGQQAWRDVSTGETPQLAGSWPFVKNGAGEKADLRRPAPDDAGVYSFQLNTATDGWVTALDPLSGLLLGYCWRSSDYPYLHQWIHSEGEAVVYRGLEFGTAAMHQSFDKQQALQFSWQGRPTCLFLDAGAEAQFEYHGFLCVADKSVLGVKDMRRSDNCITLHFDGVDEPLKLLTP